MFFTATHLANRMPHSALHTEAPFTVLFGVYATLDHLRTIGARAFVHVETRTSKLEDKVWEGRLRGCSLNSKAYRINNAETGRVTESRNVTFIDTTASQLIKSTAKNISGDNVNTQGGSPPAENTFDISVTNSEEIAGFLKKLLDLNRRDTNNLTLSGLEARATEDTSTTPQLKGAGNRQKLTRTRQEHLPTDHEPGGTTRMSTRTSGVIAPVSHEGLNSHQQREQRNLGLLASPIACDALVARAEHRSDGVQEHRMEVFLDYALATGNPISEHCSDGEVIAIPNTFKETMESPRVTK